MVYLLLNVARDQKLIEQEGKKAGVDIKVDWLKLSGGAAINDALLSSSIDIAAAGVGPLMTIWDRTHGKQNVKGVASLGNLPYYLVSNNPNVKTIADFTEKDRIALPAVSVSVQSRVLQFAAAKRWGDKDYDRLDKLTQAVPHPDAAAAIIAGGTEITGHFGNPPFQEQELAGNPKAHIVLNSYDVLGGPSSATVLYATEKFHDNNPKTYRAFIAALADAARFVSANPEAAADTYIRVNNARIDRNLLISVIKNPASAVQDHAAKYASGLRSSCIASARSRTSPSHGRTISSPIRHSATEVEPALLHGHVLTNARDACGRFFDYRSNIQSRHWNGKTVAYASACFEYAQ